MRCQFGSCPNAAFAIVGADENGPFYHACMEHAQEAQDEGDVVYWDEDALDD